LPGQEGNSRKGGDLVAASSKKKGVKSNTDVMGKGEEKTRSKTQKNGKQGERKALRRADSPGKKKKPGILVAKKDKKKDSTTRNDTVQGKRGKKNPGCGQKGGNSEGKNTLRDSMGSEILFF